MPNIFSHITFVHWLVVVSIAINLTGTTLYIRDTLAGRSKPNRVTWSMWAFAPLVGTFAALSAHADLWATSRIFLAGFTPLLVFIASFFNPQSYWKLNFFDVMCGVCSLIAVIVWIIFSSSEYAVLLAAIGDGFAMLPTLKKAWNYPATETGLTFVAGLISVLLIIPSIPKWDIVNSAFQIYLIIANVLLVGAIYRRKITKIFIR